MKKNKWLITIDLDGTFLKTGVSGEPNYAFNEKNLSVINKLLDDGHEVAIVTGRPWRDAKEVYEKIGLKTIIANYNGAHIHFPGNDSFVDLTFSMNKDILSEVLSEDIIQKSTTTYVIEGINKSYISENPDETFLNLINIDERVEREIWKYGDEISFNPQSVMLGIDFDKVDPYEILHVLKKKYGNSMFFRLWDYRKSESPWIALEINQIGSNKGTAMKYIASYYNIPLTNTIAFGDGLNDREMLLEAGLGVAMKNAKGTVKTYADDITDFTNDDAGVGRYLEEFFEI